MLIIDPKAVASAIQDPRHKLDRYAHMQLTPEQKGVVVYSKLESQGDLADLRHTTAPWIEQYTAVAEGQLGYRNFAVAHENDDQPPGGAAEHDGMIFTFHAAPSGTVALDPNTRQILTETQASIQEETFNQRLPRYTQWDFKLHEVIVTDGPERRARLMESNEEQRARAETKYLTGQEKLLEKQTAVFERLINMISSNGGQAIVTAETLKEVSEAKVLEGLQPEQIEALEQLQASEREYASERAGAPTDIPGMDIRPVKRGK